MRWWWIYALAACSYAPKVGETVEDGPACSPATEVCNEVDDDCDGEIDEGFDVGTACDGDDADMCMDGSKTCDGICVESLASKIESCTGAVDEDCNGVTDCGDPACGGTPFCCTGTGLIHTIENTCVTQDFGTSGSSDKVEVYCCEGQARFCLSKEACPWRTGCPVGNTKTCSRAGLPGTALAIAECDLWESQTSYSCSADEQITFP